MFKFAIGIITLTGFTLTAWADSPATNDRDAVPSVVAAFNDGGKKFAANPKANPITECAKHKDWYQTYCVDGFFFVQHLENLKNMKQGQVVVFKKYLAENLPKESRLRIAFARSLGASLVALDLNPQPFLGDLKDDDKLYFIDGWGSAHYHKYGFELSSQKCALLGNQRWLAACQWGMGRGFFYSSIPAGNPPMFDPNFVAGYDFARSMTKTTVMGPSEAAKIPTIGAKTAEFFKLAFYKKEGRDTLVNKLSDCLKTKHFTECSHLL